MRDSQPESPPSVPVAIRSRRKVFLLDMSALVPRQQSPLPPGEIRDHVFAFFRWAKLSNCDLSRFIIKKRDLKKELTSAKQISYLTFCDRSRVPRSSGGAEVSLALFGGVASPSDRTVLCCSSAVHCSLVCERTGRCYRRPIFAGDDLAIHSSPCSVIANRQGALVATIW
jgi:hypothetical protein